MQESFAIYDRPLAISSVLNKTWEICWRRACYCNLFIMNNKVLSLSFLDDLYHRHWLHYGIMPFTGWMKAGMVSLA